MLELGEDIKELIEAKNTQKAETLKTCLPAGRELLT
jgi:hypothetical protein